MARWLSDEAAVAKVTVRRALVMGCLALQAGRARADTREVSVRCGPEIRRAAESVAGQDVSADTLGAGCLLGAGVTPALTLTLGYGYGRSGELRVAGDDPRTSEVFHFARHDVLAGVTFAPSDEITPLLRAEGGVAAARQVERQGRIVTAEGEHRLGTTFEDKTDLRPVARLSALFEWRFREFTSASVGLYGEWAGAWAAGATLTLTLYRYW